MNSFATGNSQERGNPGFSDAVENNKDLSTENDRPAAPLEQSPYPEQPAEQPEKEREGEPALTEIKPDTPDINEEQPLPTAKPVPASPPAVNIPKDEILAEVETILAHNLTDIFVQMTPVQQEVFRKKGEETAQKIKTLLDNARAKTKKILRLIRDWLKTIPGVNKYFLEQEAKIKTDKVMEIAETKKRDRLNIEP